MKCKMIKRSVFLLMAFVMTLACFTLLPISVASAATHTVSNFGDLITAVSTAVSGDVIEIDADFGFSETITIPSGVNLTITSTGAPKTLTTGSSRHFLVRGGLTLENIILEGNGASANTGGLSVSDGTLVMNDGAVVTKCRSSDIGSGILLNNSTFTMNGGEISNNHQSNTYSGSGGGVYLLNSVFTMNDGKITNNSSVWGGGVEVDTDGLFTMNGGEISDNKATVENGGGVHVYVHGTFIMNGGKISNNKVSANNRRGGGVFAGQGSYVSTEPTDWCKFIMNGGSIEGNEAYIGGGVSAYWNGQIEMNHGTIENNTATAGGGVHLGYSRGEDDRVYFMMTGGAITGNTATSNYGGGILVDGKGGSGTQYSVKLVIGDSTGASAAVPLISGNSAHTYGGGIYLSHSNTHAAIYDGKIAGNTAGNAGGGIGVGDGSKLDLYDGVIGGETAADANQAGSMGGGVSVESNAAFTMDGGKIIGNEADTNHDEAAGGGVALLGSNPVFIMNDGEVSSNKACSGGGVSIQGTDAAKGIFTLKGGTVNGNEATAKFGGGVYATVDSVVTIDGGEITENKAAGGGGGIFAGSNSILTSIDGTNITGNSASNGGGICVHTNAALTMTDSYVADNTGINGGGIYVHTDGALTMTDSHVNNNNAGNGAGIYVTGSGMLTLTEKCHLTGNSAVDEGGGIYTQRYTGFNDSTPGDYAGVVAGDYANLSLAADTIFSENTASAVYEPPANADTMFANIGYAQSSITDVSGGYIHPLNNYDINYAREPKISLFSVTYDANDGTASPARYADAGHLSGSTYAVLANSNSHLGFTRSGYAFAGWNTVAGGTGTAYTAGDTFAIAADVTLYAQWAADPVQTYTVTYSANDGTASPARYADAGHLSGSTYAVLANSDSHLGFTRSGYAFAGWNTAAGGIGTAYPAGDTFAITADVTLYAQWTAVPVPETSVSIPPSSSGVSSPKTGDTDVTDLWMLLLCSLLAGTLCLALGRRRKKARTTMSQ